MGSRRKNGGIFSEESARLDRARKHFFRQAVWLFRPDGTPKYSQDEIGIKMAEFERQFERVARRIERRADDIAAAAERTLREPRSAGTHDANIEKARLRLEACQLLRKAVADVREAVSEVAAGRQVHEGDEDPGVQG